MPLRTYGQNCSIARPRRGVGGRWTLLVLREVFTGQRRFEEIQRNLGVATNILSDRLQTLVDEGILERRAVSDRSDRFEYRLTDKVVEHRDCGHETRAVQTCSHCGGELTARNVRLHDGPGARAAA